MLSARIVPFAGKTVVSVSEACSLCGVLALLVPVLGLEMRVLSGELSELAVKMLDLLKLPAQAAPKGRQIRRQGVDQRELGLGARELILQTAVLGSGVSQLGQQRGVG